MTLTELADKVDQLSPEAKVLQRVLEITADPNFRVEDLVSVVQLDGGLTGHVLRFCNSALFSLPRTIESLSEATMYLGSRQVANLATTFCTSRSFFSGSFDKSPFSRETLWTRSVASAFAGDLLANQSSYSVTGTAYTAGLLHDLGLSILCREVGSYADVVRQADDDLDSLTGCEQQILGFDHCQLGSEIAKRWRLGDRLVQGILNHHQETAPPQDPQLCSIVRVADVVSWQLFPDPRFQPIKVNVGDLHRLKLDEDHFEQTTEFVGRQMEVAGELLSV